MNAPADNLWEGGGRGEGDMVTIGENAMFCVSDLTLGRLVGS